MKSWRQLVLEVRADRALRIRFFATVAAGGVAIVAGFLAVSSSQAEQALRQAGYALMLAAYAAFGCALWSYRARVLRHAREALHAPAAWLVAAALALTFWFAAASEQIGFKVINDEFVLQATALNLHLEREPSVLVRAYEIEGAFTPLLGYADKRPFAFAFLLSLVHDLTGYRVLNAFVVNHALGAIGLVIVFFLGRRVAGGTIIPLTGVVLWASAPLVVQNVNGSGMEILNVTLLALAILLAWDYLEAPDESRAAGLLLTSVLLAQTRYESAAFVPAAGAIVVFGWKRAGRPIVPWAAAMVPILLLPYAWHHEITSANKHLWELRPDQDSRFASAYLPQNLRAAADFFFAWNDRMVANSWLLSAAGAIGLATLLLRRGTWRALAQLAPATALAAFAAAVAANLALLMFYYWGALNDPVVARLALPSLLIAAVASCWWLGRMQKHVRPEWMLAAVAVYALGWMRPQMANNHYTRNNLGVQQLTWEKQVLASRVHRAPPLVVSNKTALPWLIERQPAVILFQARTRRDELRFHLEAQTFEIYVMQRLQPSTAEGNYVLEPDDVLPAEFKLRTIAEKRFGATIGRISQLVEIAAAGETASATQPL